MSELLPDRLQAMWAEVRAGRMMPEAFEREQARLLEVYRRAWEEALLLEGQRDLTESLLTEIALYLGCDDLADIRRRCERAVAAVAEEWVEAVQPADRGSVEHYYDRSESYIYDLMWWHRLADDPSPLAYVTALHFARRHGCRRHLDFGSGVGAGGILFARHGLDVHLADISSTLLAFSRWRLARRRQPATLIDLKAEPLPQGAFDIITAMDVFEHLVDPVGTVEALSQALTPGGFLFGRFHGEVDPDHPQHIVLDFEPTLRRIEELGFEEVWRDDWLWGHRAFRKPGGAP